MVNSSLSLFLGSPHNCVSIALKGGTHFTDAVPNPRTGKIAAEGIEPSDLGLNPFFVVTRKFIG